MPVARPAVPSRRVEVSRPEPPVIDAPGPPPQAVAPLAQVLREERTYWQRHQTFARYPRAVGLGLVGLGGFLLYSTVDTLLHGGYYGVRSTITAPVVVLAGAWSVAFGYPLERSGRPPAWWTAGLVACVISGFLIGLALLAALSDR